MTPKQEIIDLARECGLTGGMLEFVSLGRSPIEQFYRAAYAAGLEAGADKCTDPYWTNDGHGITSADRRCYDLLLKMAKEIRE